MNKVLIVEDEKAINQVLRAYLVKNSFNTIQAYDGEEALEFFIRSKPDLVLLDAMLPEKSGWELLTHFRSIRFCPIIMITALDGVENRLKGFQLGADDYITKPFYGDEVVARCNAVMRRIYFSNESHSFWRIFGSLKIDLKASQVYINDEQIQLPPRELQLLLWFSGNPNKTFSRDQLLDAVWGIDYDGSDRAVDLSIKRLRQYLAGWSNQEGEIKTIRGLGYQMATYEGT